MGPLQTYFYLALVSSVLIALALVFAGIAYRSLRRWVEREHHTPLVFWLAGTAVTVALLVVVVGAAGVFYGFMRYGGT